MAETQTWFADAARGDLDALRMLRDAVMDECRLPLDDRLAQGELLARLAAEAGGPMDKLAHASLLLLRAEDAANKRDVAVAQQQGSADHAEAEIHRASAEAHDHRSNRYREQAEEIFPAIACGDDPDAAAMLVHGLTLRADRGEDHALTLLQRLMDGMPATNLRAVKAALRNLEQEIDA